jgi:hypothetical protein
MFHSVLRQLISVDRTQLHLRSSLLCMITIAGALAVGLALGRPAIGMIAAGGAMSVGLGSFHQMGRSRVRPMLWASIGMGISTVVGSAVGHAGPFGVLNATGAGFAGGMLLALGPGAAWVGQQCAIAALVAGGYPTGLDLAFSRGLLLLLGGLTQTGVVVACWHFGQTWKIPGPDDPYAGLAAGLRTLRENLAWQSPAFRFAVRQGGTLAVGAAMAHRLHLANGYWVPMTALLVIRPDFQQTFSRGLARIGGTVIGAIVASLLVARLHPSVVLLALLIVPFAWMAYAVVNVNYAAFSISLTAYIVFLLAFAGLPTKAVILHRTLNTALGGLLALLSFVTMLWVRRRREAPARSDAARAPGAGECTSDRVE